MTMSFGKNKDQHGNTDHSPNVNDAPAHGGLKSDAEEQGRTSASAGAIGADRLQPGTKQGAPEDALRSVANPESEHGKHGKTPQIDKNKLPARDTTNKYDGNHNDAGQHLSHVMPHPEHPDGRSLETAMPPKPFMGNGEMQKIEDTTPIYSDAQRIHRLELRLKEVCDKAGIVYDPEEKEREERAKQRFAEAKKDDRTEVDVKYAKNVPAAVPGSNVTAKEGISHHSAPDATR